MLNSAPAEPPGGVSERWLMLQCVRTCKENSGERVLEREERGGTCGGCGTDGFSPDAGSDAREVDNKIIIGA